MSAPQRSRRLRHRRRRHRRRGRARPFIARALRPAPREGRLGRGDERRVDLDDPRRPALSRVRLGHDAPIQRGRRLHRDHRTPHGVPRCFLVPILPHDRNNIERMETAMEVYDRFQPLKKSNPHVRLTAREARQAEPGLTPDLIGAVTLEEWGVDPHRLVYANVAGRRRARRPGAQPHASHRADSRRWQGDRRPLPARRRRAPRRLAPGWS